MKSLRMRGIAALALGVATSCVSIRAAFKDLTFPDEGRAVEPRLSIDQVREIRLHAMLAPLLLSGYASPVHAASCMGAVFRSAESVSDLYKFGMCAAEVSEGSSVRDRRWVHCMSSEYPFLQCRPGSSTSAMAPLRSASCRETWPEECTVLTEDDKIAVHTTLAHVGEALAGFELEDKGSFIQDGGTTSADAPLDQLERERIGRVVAAALSMMRCDEGAPGSWCHADALREDRAPDPLRPALALSGGAANGAFLAGYVYELLSAREAALAHGASSVAEDRITAVTGTSVGALIAPMVDLYFADDALARKNATKEALAWCEDSTVVRGYEPPPDCSTGAADCDPVPPAGPRSIQRCALRMLRKYLTDVHIQDLLCIHDGNVHEPFGAGQLLLGPLTSLGAFEPLEERILRPFMDRFWRVLLDDDVIHVVMTTDLMSDVGLGLDERACWKASTPAGCLTESVLASLPNPIFARAPVHVTMGLDDVDRLKVNGYWLDGGLRSGSPALRAMLLTRITGLAGRRGGVLALSTELAQGGPLPSAEPGGALENWARSVGALVNQGHLWETAFASLYQREHAHDAEVVGRLRSKQPNHLIAEETATADKAVYFRTMSSSPPPLEGLGDLYTVFLPSSLPGRLLASGYQFDPLRMRGLFLEGQRLAIEHMRDRKRRVLEFLAWKLHKNQAFDFSRWITARRGLIARRISAWQAKEDEHERDRPRRIQALRDDIERMDTCKRGHWSR